MKQIYMDYAATAPVDRRVADKMNKVIKEYSGNPSSVHRYGQNCKMILEKSRKEIAAFINADPGNLVFTSGGTESNNLAIIGYALANRSRGSHLILSQIEHPAVMKAGQFLKNLGFEISYLGINDSVEETLKALDRIIRADTILVSVMTLNNETGQVLPVEQIGYRLRNKDIAFHSDAVQALGKCDIDIQKLPVDLMSFSAHKVNGPAGMGALFVRRGIDLSPLMVGGSQESNRRAGTENLAAIAGFAEALFLIRQSNKEPDNIRNMRDQFESGLKRISGDIIINSARHQRGPHISNAYIPFIPADALLMRLDMNGIAVSTGSACSSGSVRPSYVLTGLGFDENYAKHCVRFSFGRFTTMQEIEHVIAVIEDIQKQTG